MVRYPFNAFILIFFRGHFLPNSTIPNLPFLGNENLPFEHDIRTDSV